MGALDSLYNQRAAQWPAIYEAIKDILGNTGTIICMGDIRRGGQPNATTFTTTRGHASGVEAVFTWSEAPSAFDTAFLPAQSGNWQGIIPFVTFNGTDEEADTPDAAYWSRNDAAAEKMSIGLWVNHTNFATADKLYLGKKTASNLEWSTYADVTTGTVTLSISDNSAAVSASRQSDAGIAAGVWNHIVFTYDGGGGATAANGITIYVNGAAAASTATNNASYVAMENLTSIVRLAHATGPASYFVGKMAGGPLGPFFTQIELTAAQCKRLYEIGRDALAL